MSEMGSLPYLQILVCTFGKEGMDRLVASDYPEVEGVEYLVSWQLPEEDCDIPPALARRSDFRVVKSKSRGLSRNRNEALRLAEAEVCLIADDDLSYDADALRELMEYHRLHPENEIVCVHCSVGGKTLQTYSDKRFDLRRRPRGYYFVSVEISFKREAVERTGVSFEELMGVGAPVLKSGEEEVFVLSLLRKGLRGVCIPLVVCDHPGLTTTGERVLRETSYLMVRGALLRFKHVMLWGVFLPFSALMTSRHTHRGYIETLRWMARGARYTKQNKIF